MRRFEVTNWTTTIFIGVFLLFTTVLPGLIQRVKTHRVNVDGNQYQVLVDANIRQVRILSAVGATFVFPAEGGKLISRQTVRSGHSLVEMIDLQPNHMEQKIWSHYYGSAASPTERK